jgi:hypothetical protein
METKLHLLSLGSATCPICIFGQVFYSLWASVSPGMKFNLDSVGMFLHGSLSGLKNVNVWEVFQTGLAY